MGPLLQVAEGQASFFPDGQSKAAPVQVGSAHVLDLLHVLQDYVHNWQRSARLAAQPLHVADILYSSCQCEAGVLGRRCEFVIGLSIYVPCKPEDMVNPACTGKN